MKDCPLFLIAQALSLLDLLYDSLGFEVHCGCLMCILFLHGEERDLDFVSNCPNT